MAKQMFEVLVSEFLNEAKKNALFSLINDFEDGAWRYVRFQNYIWDNIGETCLTMKERNSLVNHSLLVQAAKNLRLTDADEKGKGSELAEIVLYGIMKHYYRAIPVVPKIFYKQNPQDNAKGSDSVHIVLEDNGDFSLWLGEAKFYNSIEDERLAAVIKSVATSLQTGKLKKENSIITNLSELNNVPMSDDLRKRILNTLSNDASIDDLKPRLHIPILLLHECARTQACKEMSDEYRKDLKKYHKERATTYFSKQTEALISINKVSQITFHVILFPVPSKMEVVKRFLEAVQFYKGQK